jgi:hypothetical protein
VQGYEYVTGYIYQNDIVIDEDTEDITLLTRGNIVNEKVVYENGILEEREPDEYLVTIHQKENEITSLTEKVENEYKIFMDNLMGGMTVEEALKEAQANRDALEKTQESYNAMQEERRKEIFDLWETRNKEEEEGMTWNYYVSACLLIRDENRYLLEWLSWHLSQGFEHIYIYDNGVNEEVTDIIPENMKDQVTIIPWQEEYTNVQEEAYNNFLSNYGTETRWVNFIDSDEFVRMVEDTPMKAFLEACESYSIVRVDFLEYNANGLETYEDKPVRERFTQTVNVMDGIYHKDFIQCHRIDRMDRHYPMCSQRGNYTLEDIQEQVIIDHYYTKSWEEWKQKIERGSSDPDFLKWTNEFFVYNPDMAYLKEEENQVQEYKA